MAGETELRAVKGKTRVVGVDLFDRGDYPVGGGDYDDREEALRVVDDHNEKRSSSMDDVYYAYDDTGTNIRGPKDVAGQGVSP